MADLTPGDPVGVNDAVALVLAWVVAEMEFQAAAHGAPLDDDLTDHVRCYLVQPGRRSAVPWPVGVPRPDVVLMSPGRFGVLAALLGKGWAEELRPAGDAEETP